MTLRSPWIVPLKTGPHDRAALVCFPHGGGTARSFRPFATLLPDAVALYGVQLPGREERFGEASPCRWDEVVPAVAGALLDLCALPLILLGHSLGGLIAFEVARELRRQGLEQPRHLVVSAVRAPHLPSRRAPISRLPDAEFTQELARFNGTPSQVLGDSELLGLLLPRLRGDFALSEAYACGAAVALAQPITALGGLADRIVRGDELEAWAEHTQKPFRVRFFEGDHFYLFASAAPVFRYLRDAVLDPLPG